jgi:hypothetical protein
VTICHPPYANSPATIASRNAENGVAVKKGVASLSRKEAAPLSGGTAGASARPATTIPPIATSLAIVSAVWTRLPAFTPT